MLHVVRAIPLERDHFLTLGFVMCFSEPTPTLVLTRGRGESNRETVAEITLPAERLEELISALDELRAEVARHADG